MDNTESDQEASTQSSPEDTSRQIDLRAIGSPTFEPLSLVQIDRTPPEEGTEEEERESSESETEMPRRRIRFSTPISIRIPDPPILFRNLADTYDLRRGSTNEENPF